MGSIFGRQRLTIFSGVKAPNPIIDARFARLGPPPELVVFCETWRLCGHGSGWFRPDHLLESENRIDIGQIDDIVIWSCSGRGP